MTNSSPSVIPMAYTMTLEDILWKGKIWSCGPRFSTKGNANFFPEAKTDSPHKTTNRCGDARPTCCCCLHYLANHFCRFVALIDTRTTTTDALDHQCHFLGGGVVDGFLTLSEEKYQTAGPLPRHQTTTVVVGVVVLRCCLIYFFGTNNKNPQLPNNRCRAEQPSLLFVWLLLVFFCGCCVSLFVFFACSKQKVANGIADQSPNNLRQAEQQPSHPTTTFAVYMVVLVAFSNCCWRFFAEKPIGVVAGITYQLNNNP
jgi:hypothetical protein